MHPVNGRRRYIVTSSLIGWAHAQNDPCYRDCFNIIKMSVIQIKSYDNRHDVLLRTETICIIIPVWQYEISLCKHDDIKTVLNPLRSEWMWWIWIWSHMHAKHSKYPCFCFKSHGKFVFRRDHWQCVNIGSGDGMVWSRQASTSGWLVGWLNRFIYRTNIVRAPKLESLTG